MSTLAAVLWDLDGTLVDTEPVWMAAETDLAASHGVTWTAEQGLHLVGRALIDSASIFQELTGVPMSREEIVAALVAGVTAEIQRALTWRPGVRELLAEVRAAGLQQGLVTMSYAPIADEIVRLLPADTFDVVVTGEDVVRGKPDPEPYLRAAQQLGVEPSSCLVFEDSPTGLASSVAAGCVAIAVPLHVSIAPGDGYRVAGSLSGVTLSDVRAWHATGTSTSV